LDESFQTLMYSWFVFILFKSYLNKSSGPIASKFEH